MPAAPQRSEASDLFIPRAQEAVGVAESILADAVIAVRKRVAVDGDTLGRLFDREQRATHGLAWLATYVESLRQLLSYAMRMREEGKFGEIEELEV
ncbi:MAG: acyl-CoA dehydrogenase, partial [Pseudorhodoplanes sp.]